MPQRHRHTKPKQISLIALTYAWLLKFVPVTGSALFRDSPSVILEVVSTS